MDRFVKLTAGIAAALALMLCVAAPRAAADTPDALPAAAGKPAPAPLPKAAPAPKPTAAPFPDVPATHPAAAAVASVKNKKFMTAKTDGKFHGADYVTRYELAVILDRFVTYNEEEHKPVRMSYVTGPFKLSAPANHWAHAAQLRLASNGFLPKTSPILTGLGTAKVSKDELTQALASVEVRLSDRSLSPQDTGEPTRVPPAGVN